MPCGVPSDRRRAERRRPTKSWAAVASVAFGVAVASASAANGFALGAERGTALRGWHLAAPSQRAVWQQAQLEGALEVTSDLAPLSSYVLVKPKEAVRTTKGGLVLPTSKDKPSEGQVLAAGPGTVDEETGVRKPVWSQAGMTVLHTKYGAEEVEHNGEDYVLVRDEDVLLSYAGEEPTLENIRMPPGKVLLRLVEGESQSQGGILFSKGATKPDTTLGEVVAVSEGVYDRDGKLVPLELQAGDMVRFRYGSEVKLDVGKSEFRAVDASDCRALSREGRSAKVERQAWRYGSFIVATGDEAAMLAAVLLGVPATKATSEFGTSFLGKRSAWPVAATRSLADKDFTSWHLFLAQVGYHSGRAGEIKLLPVMPGALGAAAFLGSLHGATGEGGRRLSGSAGGRVYGQGSLVGGALLVVTVGEAGMQGAWRSDAVPSASKAPNATEVGWQPHLEPLGANSSMGSAWPHGPAAGSSDVPGRDAVAAVVELIERKVEELRPRRELLQRCIEEALASAQGPEGSRLAGCIVEVVGSTSWGGEVPQSDLDMVLVSPSKKVEGPQ
ncbi:unnamed protein product, partial [Polarella glacialis]